MTDITFGNLIQDSISLEGEQDTYTFDGLLGEQLFLRLSTASFSLDPAITILRPDGTILIEESSFGDIEVAPILDTNGPYTLIVEGRDTSDTGEYSLLVQNLTNPVNSTPLTFGTPTSANLGVSNEIDTYTFNGAVGEQIILQTGESSILALTIEIIKPDGTILELENDLSSTLQASLDQNGSYTVLVKDGFEDGTGDYGLTLQRTTNPSNITPLDFGNQVSTTISSLGELDTYSFSGTPGDEIYLYTNGNPDAFISFRPEVRIFDPDGNLVTEGDGSQIELPISITSNRSYTVIVGDRDGSEIDDYNITIQRTNNPANATAINFGVPVSGEINSLGERDTYTFNGEEGDLLSLYDSRASDLGFLIFRPDGTLLEELNSFDPPQYLLDNTGTHTVLVGDRRSNSTGAYNFTLQRTNNPGNTIPLGFGDFLSPSIDLLGEQDTYTFAAVAGDQVSLNISASNFALAPNVQVFNPDGSLLRESDDVSEVDLQLSLEQNGTYTVLVGDDAGDNTGDYGINIQRTNNPVNPTQINFGDRISTTIQSVGEEDTYTIQAEAGDFIFLNMLDLGEEETDIDPEIKFFAPDGTLLEREEVGTFSSVDIDLVIGPLEASGTYTLLAADGDRKTGPYALTIERTNNPVDATPILPGENIPERLNQFGEKKVYTFTGNEGDTLFLKGIVSEDGIIDTEEEELDLEVKVFRPDGSLLNERTVVERIPNLFGNNFSRPSQLQTPLDTTGEYTIIVGDSRGNSGLSTGNAIGDFSFIFDLNQEPPDPTLAATPAPTPFPPLETISIRRGNEILIDSDRNGEADRGIFYGEGATEDEYLVGDWDGDGADELAVRRDNVIHIDNNSDGTTDRYLFYGTGAGEDEYLVGDWDGDGTDELAVRRRNEILIDDNSDGVADRGIFYGTGLKGEDENLEDEDEYLEDEYLVGDWDGDGTDELAVRRGNEIIIDDNSDGVADRGIFYGTGVGEDEYLVGDWDNDGTDELAVRRGNRFLMNYDTDAIPNQSLLYGLGNAEDEYLVGVFSDPVV